MDKQQMLKRFLNHSLIDLKIVWDNDFPIDAGWTFTVFKRVGDMLYVVPTQLQEKIEANEAAEPDPDRAI